MIPVSRGLGYVEAAQQAKCSRGTFSRRVNRACNRLDVGKRREALEKCRVEGWLTADVPLEGDPGGREIVITKTQRQYIETFERWLRSDSEVDAREMSGLLGRMFSERGLLPPSLRPQADLAA